jgi:pimeloyl-ACP methyl ester carboxylesterase
MTLRRIHTLHRPAAGRTLLPPLVFVHGGYATVRCWDEYFLPYFNHRGFDCHALDLSGHGESEGHERLDSFGIDDYVEDLTQVARQLSAPAVFIGHSMSTVVVERFLEQNTARAAILMAPVPPGGILGASIKMALTKPAFFSEQLRPAGGEQSAQTMRSVYYSRETEIDDLMRFAGFFQSESRRAILDLSLLAMRIGRRRPALPVLVVGGAADAVFEPALLGLTAARWQAEEAVIPRAGHTLMLDAHWQAAADTIADWLDRQLRGETTAVAREKAS